jgi:hypothetical protein
VVVGRRACNLIAKLQENDSFVARKHNAAKGEAIRKKEQELQGRWNFKDGLLYYLHRLYVPDDDAIWSELFAYFHKGPLAGHFGEKGTLELIQRHYH